MGARTRAVIASLLVVSCGGAPTTTAPAASSPPATAEFSPTPPAASPTLEPWRAATEPPGGPAATTGNAAPEGTRWIEIRSFDGRGVLAAMYAPTGSAPAPIVIHLHGDGGMQRRDLEFGISLARDGFLALVPCWQGIVGRNPRALACTAGAPLRRTASDLAKELSAIADVARTLPGASRDRLVVVGHSGGGAAALLAASSGGRFDAVVAASAPYPTGDDEASVAGVKVRWGTTPTESVDGLSMPVLIMHGIDDRQATATLVEKARAYEKVARDQGKKVEAIYVQPGGHEFVFFPEVFTADRRAKFVAFIKG